MNLRTGPVLCAVFLALLAPSALRASNIVSNGNFSSGNADWTVNTSSSYPWGFGNQGSYDGNTNYADTGCAGAACITGTAAQQASLSQDLATVAGDSYTLAFEFTPNGPTSSSYELEALFGSTVAYDKFGISNTGDYVTYTISGLVATSTSTDLEFLGRQDYGYNRLTDVSVTDDGAASITPEPSSLWLLGSGLVALAGMVHRKIGMRA